MHNPGRAGLLKQIYQREAAYPPRIPNIDKIWMEPTEMSQHGGSVAKLRRRALVHQNVYKLLRVLRFGPDAAQGECPVDPGGVLIGCDRGVPGQDFDVVATRA
jgi:hypothetical protein